MAAGEDSEMLSRVPVVVILGSTGSGKSKLAIEIARRFGGEIVSADSMQVYKGLDIITNKVTLQERNEAPHHMIDFVDPLQRFTVVDFRNKALHIIDDLLSSNTLPIIVGGTNYYIESLLWRVLVAEARAPSSPLLTEDEPPNKRRRYDNVPSEELHRRLKLVDPDMASRLHPNNRRRITRSLQVFEELGRTHSSILKEQREEEGGSTLGGPLRYPHSCLLWLQPQQKVLDERLDARVADMLSHGLVDELLAFHDQYNQQRLATDTEADYTAGIFQSIGFKEFHSYLLLAAADRETPEGCKLFQQSVEQLKMATRRYARKQQRWLTNRFLRQPDRQVPPVYSLDSTEPSRWDDMVYKPAVHIVDCYMKGAAPTDIHPLPVEDALVNKPTSYQCDVCNRVFIGDIQWKAHLRSKKHHKQLKQHMSENSSDSDCPGSANKLDRQHRPDSSCHAAVPQEAHTQAPGT